MFTIAEVNLQSQRFQMGGDDAITFLTLDGFNVRVEGTIEYALIPDKVAKLTQEVGEMGAWFDRCRHRTRIDIDADRRHAAASSIARCSTAT